MGCGTSKLDDEGQLPAQLRPFRGKIEEIKQRRRVRHASIVSTTELLSPEDREDEDSVEKAVDNEKVTPGTEKEKENTTGEMVKRGDDEFPGSPSFRVYCREPAAAAARDSDDDSVKVIQKIKDDRLAQEKERTQATEEKGRVKAHGRENSHDSLISIEDSSHKPLKKEKGRRFRGLTKAPSRMYSFLTVKSCYGPGNTEETSDESPDPCHHALKSS